MRLNKYLAQCGICSRRDADRLIEAGRVSVNGIAARVGQSIVSGDLVAVDGKAVQDREREVVLAYYKPVGVTCTERDPHARIKVKDMVDFPVRVTYAGRLDKDSEGLLLLTNDGDLINAMMRGANVHEKEYLVKVDKNITPVFISKMEQGVYLKELDVTTRPCKVTQIGKFTFRIILTQGINRQIRRMCAENGYRVMSIRRTRVVNIELGNLKPGQYRELREDEYSQLYDRVGLQYGGN